MTIETRSITVRAFRDPDGNPTCGTTEGFCRFSGVGRLGTVPVCLAAPGIYIRRRSNGYTEPCNGCPVWNTPAASDG